MLLKLTSADPDREQSTLLIDSDEIASVEPHPNWPETTIVNLRAGTFSTGRFFLVQETPDDIYAKIEAGASKLLAAEPKTKETDP